MGLAGFYLLKDDSEADQRLPRDGYDIPMMVQDRAFTRDGELDYDHDGHHGAVGKVMLVNGAPWPVLEVAARKVSIPDPECLERDARAACAQQRAAAGSDRRLSFARTAPIPRGG